MAANTEAQAQLHPALVGTEARRVIEIAKEHGALGYKVNGAGGEGGSLTLLCGEDSAQRQRPGPRDRAGRPGLSPGSGPSLSARSAGLELLSQVAPGVEAIGVLFEPAVADEETKRNLRGSMLTVP